jgi:hypothetical protein
MWTMDPTVGHERMLRRLAKRWTRMEKVAGHARRGRALISIRVKAKVKVSSAANRSGRVDNLLRQDRR